MRGLVSVCLCGDFAHRKSGFLFCWPTFARACACVFDYKYVCQFWVYVSACVCVAPPHKKSVLLLKTASLGHGSDAALESPRTSDLQLCCDSSSERIGSLSQYPSSASGSTRSGRWVKSVCWARWGALNNQSSGFGERSETALFTYESPS